MPGRSRDWWEKRLRKTTGRKHLAEGRGSGSQLKNWKEGNKGSPWDKENSSRVFVTVIPLGTAGWKAQEVSI